MSEPYTYTDTTGDKLRINSNGYCGVTLIAGGPALYPCKSVLIAAEDAPTVAAELLKAAGQEGVFVPKAAEEVCTFDSDIISCGTGPEEVLARNYDNPNWLRNKAANCIALAEYIENEDQRETEAATKLQERRESVLKELGHGFKYDAMGKGAPMQKAVDRIIELEDKQAA